jgi:hypothetical protein
VFSAVDAGTAAVPQPARNITAGRKKIMPTNLPALTALLRHKFCIIGTTKLTIVPIGLTPHKVVQ